MRALSIRQPYAELILRGIKTIEYRSRPTRIIGERFYIYAASKPGDPKGFDELGCVPGDLPTGLIVGTAVITGCERNNRHPRNPRNPRNPRGYEWHLEGIRRLRRPRRPRRMPSRCGSHRSDPPADADAPTR